MNLADKEFASGNYQRGYDLLNAYLPVTDAKEDYRDFLWYLLWKENHLEKQTLNGHLSSVLSVAWSSDGKTLASGSWDKTIRLWDIATGRELRTLQGHSDAVTSVAWSSNGKSLASESGNQTIILWTAAMEEEVMANTPDYLLPKRIDPQPRLQSPIYIRRPAKH